MQQQKSCSDEERTEALEFLAQLTLCGGASAVKDRTGSRRRDRYTGLYIEIPGHQIGEANGFAGCLQRVHVEALGVKAFCTSKEDVVGRREYSIRVDKASYFF